jgi:hypothetical protein
VLYTGALIVLSTIQLDAEAVLVAIKIEDIGSNRVLTSKLQAAKPAVPHTVPEEFFWISLVTPELAHECEIVRG